MTSKSLSFGQLQGISPINEVTLTSDTKLKIDGILRFNTLQSLTGQSLLTSSANNTNFPGNLNVSGELSGSSVNMSELNLPKWTANTRPEVNLQDGIVGYNIQTNKLEAYTSTYGWIVLQKGPTTIADFKAADLPKDGLSLYLDANVLDSYPRSGNTWFDLSGNSRNFTWVNSPSFALSSPSYFSTLGNRCTGPASNSFGITNTSGYTIFSIFKQNTLVNTNTLTFYKGNATGIAGRGIFAHLTWGDDTIYFDQGGCCEVSSRTQVPSGGSQNWNIWTLRRFTNSSTRTISKNGNTLVTNSAAALTLDLDARPVDICSGDQQTSSTWNSQLGAFIVYNRGLSDAEVLEVYNKIKTRFGRS
jgi:hypothetical protein